MPVYSSHLLRYDEIKLGERIRRARQERNFTLRELAARLKMSPARMSQIENDRLHLDIDEVQQLASALGIPLDGLVPPDVTIPFQITRDAALRARETPQTLFAEPDGIGIPSPHGYLPLANLFVGRHLEPVLARLAAVPEPQLRLYSHHEEEFVFALRGTIEFRLKTPDGDCLETLSRGDCLYFRSDLPHAFRSLEPDGAESLHVFCSPSASAAAGVDWALMRAVIYEGETGPVELRRLVGQKLRVVRELHGWPTERVARLSGLSSRSVAAIERGERGVPLDAMLSLARAFGRPLRELIGLAVLQPPYYFVRRSTDIASIPSRQRRTPVERPHAPHSKTCQPLVSGFPAQEMYPYFLRMLNVDVDTLALHEHHGQEFIYVLDGELELTTYSGGREVRDTLRAGDSCYLDSTVPHLLRSWTRNPYSDTSAQVVDVFWCPLGEGYLFGDARTDSCATGSPRNR